MEFTIDQTAIAKAMSETATEAIKQSLTGYQMTSAISKVMTDEIASGVMARAIQSAVRQIDTDDLVIKLAEELQKTVVSAATAILREGVVDIVCKLRGIGNYGEDKEQRERIRQQLKMDSAT